MNKFFRPVITLFAFSFAAAFSAAAKDVRDNERADDIIVCNIVNAEIFSGGKTKTLIEDGVPSKIVASDKSGTVVAAAILGANERRTLPDAANLQSLADKYRVGLRTEYSCRGTVAAGYSEIPSFVAKSSAARPEKQDSCSTPAISVRRARAKYYDAEGKEKIVEYFQYEGSPESLVLSDNGFSSDEERTARNFISAVLSGKRLRDADLSMLKHEAPSMSFSAFQSCNVAIDTKPTKLEKTVGSSHIGNTAM